MLAFGASAWGQAPATKKTNPPAQAKGAQEPAAPVDLKAEAARIAAEAAKNRAELDRVLAEWEERSKKVTSLDVSFDRIDRSPGWGDTYYQGRAMLQSPDLACLQFQKYKLDKQGKPVLTPDKDGKPVPVLLPDPFERIVCTGQEVLQYSWDEKKMFIHPLDKSQRQKALQQGPLPFLFNLKAADLKQRYSMTLLKEDDRDYLIGIVPTEKIDRDSFNKAFLWLSKKTFLPNQLWLLPIGNKERQEFVFAGGLNRIVANAKLRPEFFRPTRFEGWKVIDNPGGEPAAPKNNAAAPAANPPAGKTAAKPGSRPK
jgi:TIGR03009 family protein